MQPSNACTIRIADSILHQWPQAKVSVAWVRGQVLNPNKAKGPPINYLSELKQETVRGLIDKKITAANYSERPVCQSWQRVFTTFKAPEEKKSTIDNLLRRAALQADIVAASQGKKKADLGKISTIVDFYNCVSMQTETPMGALRKDAIKGDIVLRHGVDGETFVGLGKTDEVHSVTKDHVVYADDASVLTWLWNFKDGKHCCVPATTEGPIDVLIFADQAEEGAGDVKAALKVLVEKTANIGWQVIDMAVLNKDAPVATLSEDAAALSEKMSRMLV